MTDTEAVATMLELFVTKAPPPQMLQIDKIMWGTRAGRIVIRPTNNGLGSADPGDLRFEHEELPRLVMNDTEMRERLERGESYRSIAELAASRMRAPRTPRRYRHECS